MGIEYYVFNPKSKSLFELGKGAWSNFDFAQCLYPETLPDYIKSLHERDGCVFRMTNGSDADAYIRFIASRLLNFIGNCPLEELKLVNDCGGHDEYMDYIITDGRYAGLTYTYPCFSNNKT